MNRDNNIEPNKNPFMPPTNPTPKDERNHLYKYISPLLKLYCIRLSGFAIY